MYQQRQDFMIVALTGITGSGCSDFAKLMATPFAEWEENGDIRSLKQIDSYLSENKKENYVFAREYKSCYNLCKKQYEDSFQIIKYRNVLMLHVVLELSHKSQSYDNALELISKMISGKFHHSYETDEERRKKKVYTEEHYDVDCDFSAVTIKQMGFDESIYNSASAISEDNKVDLWNLYISERFQMFCEHLYDEMKRRDYYAKNFFVHRLACSIRATGGCESTGEQNKNARPEHLFTVVELINKLIKGFHRKNEKDPRRFVIDSIRNSMEIMYLRERFSAFYMIALHNDACEDAKLREKVQNSTDNKELVEKISKNIIELSKVEKEIDDFEKGLFFAPDLSRCVTESEIHIQFNSLGDLEREKKLKEEGLTTRTFYTFGEQWMKLYALILHPGLITPTRDERCMSIAYVAKFNSGCISRQVGCTIVDKENAVQSVGWNDPPAPQLPCNLRYVDEFIDDDKLNGVNTVVDENGKHPYRVYSKFECSDTTEYIIKKEGTEQWRANGFRGCMYHEADEAVMNALNDIGLPYPYCFRTKYNKYKGYKDQVNTRSLHAEENTMLRIARRGGVGLDGGTMYVTASPCVLCSKKAYQIGIRDIVYLDPYTDIAPDLILECGFGIPNLRPFRGVIGETFYKLYRPFLPYKDELAIYESPL